MKDILTDVILSIKPVYADAILNGSKQVEFRRKVFKRDVDKVFIYSSSPTQQIIGYFTIDEIVEEKPSYLWKEYNSVGGIQKNDFFKYFDGLETGFTIKIDKVKRFHKGVNPKEVIENFTAPQSYLYVEKKTASNIR
jgi:predicted transcriptional regulator